MSETINKLLDEALNKVLAQTRMDTRESVQGAKFRSSLEPTEV